MTRRRKEKRKERDVEYNSSNIIEIIKFKDFLKNKVDIIPRTENQEKFIIELEKEENDIIVAYGPAGTGKTYLATLWAIKKFREGVYSKIVISRPNVPTDNRDIGYLPGDIFSKMYPWVLPIIDLFKEYYRKDQIEQMIKGDIIELVPLTYVRGRTFKNAIIIIDEAQNLTPSSIKSFLTRIGENSKMILAGDINQSDHHEKSGLLDLIQRLEKHKVSHIAVVKFDGNDVQRSRAIREVLKIYED